MPRALGCLCICLIERSNFGNVVASGESCLARLGWLTGHTHTLLPSLPAGTCALLVAEGHLVCRSPLTLSSSCLCRTCFLIQSFCMLVFQRRGVSVSRLCAPAVPCVGRSWWPRDPQAQSGGFHVKAISLMKQWAPWFISQLLLCADMPSAILGGQIVEINRVCV